MTAPKHALEKHSYTKLSTFQSCQRKFYFDQLFPESEAEKKEAFAHGTAVHLALEQMAQAALQQRTTFGEMVMQIAGPNPVLLQAMAARKVLAGSRPLEVEKWFAGIDTLNIRGKIDLIGSGLPIVDGSGKVVSWQEGTKFIVDYKTTGNPMSIPDQETTERSLQLGLYSLATKREIRDVGYIYILPTLRTVARFAHMEDKFLDRCLAWAREQCAAIEAKMGAFDEKDEAGFALAAFDYQYCNARNCRHWARCLGKGQLGSQPGRAAQDDRGTADGAGGAGEAA